MNRAAHPRQASRALLGPLVLVWGLILSACGYVRVQVTEAPPTPTVTPTRHLVLPERRATATRVPATPRPTSSPTPTATPIVHVVQKGDMLLQIANQYQVNVQAIIQANDIPNPNALPIGQHLIIPRSDQEAATQATPTPTPLPLELIHVGVYRTPADTVWCMGEVRNPHDQALDMVQVQVTLYDQQGEPIDQAAAFTAVDVLPAAGEVPFAVLLTEAVGYASYQIEILSAQRVENWGGRHRSLELEILAVETSHTVSTVQGVLYNRGEQDAQGVRITVTGYGADGAVVGVRQLALDRIAAGQEIPFTLTLISIAPATRLGAAAEGMNVSP